MRTLIAVIAAYCASPLAAQQLCGFMGARVTPTEKPRHCVRPVLQSSAAELPVQHPFVRDGFDCVRHAVLRPKWLTTWLKAVNSVAKIAPKAFSIWSAAWTATILAAMGLSRVQLKLFDRIRTVVQFVYAVLSYKKNDDPSIIDLLAEFFDRNFVILMTVVWGAPSVMQVKACHCLL